MAPQPNRATGGTDQGCTLYYVHSSLKQVVVLSGGLLQNGHREPLSRIREPANRSEAGSPELFGGAASAEFTADFGAYGFALAKRDAHSQLRQIDAHVLFCPQMHLDARGAMIEESHVLESVQNKICSPFTIQAPQEVQVKRGGHTCAIIVGAFDHRYGFEHVQTDGQVIGAVHDCSDLFEKSRTFVGGEVTYRAAQKQNHLPAAAGQHLQ
jgi:hypothetical protein